MASAPTPPTTPSPPVGAPHRLRAEVAVPQQAKAWGAFAQPSTPTLGSNLQGVATRRNVAPRCALLISSHHSHTVGMGETSRAHTQLYKHVGFASFFSHNGSPWSLNPR